MSLREVAEAVCPRCDGRGWVLEQDGGAGTAQPCECQADRVVPRLVARVGIPPRFERCTLDNFQVSDLDEGSKHQKMEALTQSRRYVERFVGEEGREHGLLYSGPTGVGKTHLATAVLLQLVERYRVDALFVDCTALIHRLQNTFEPGAGLSKREVLDPVLSVDVLLIDDLGAQKGSGWVNEILYLIFNERYARRLATIVTSNLRRERESERAAENLGERPRHEAGRPSMVERLPASLVSRLHEMTRPIDIEAGDYRREIKFHQHLV